MDFIRSNLASINERLCTSCAKAGRASEAVRLIAVSKFQPVEAVKAALETGQLLFGENRVQEARDKFAVLKLSHPDLELHLIGPLQTNKALEAVRTFDVIQTLDRQGLAEELAKAMRKLGKQVPCYIEINIGKEPQKAGIAPEELDAFLKLCRVAYGLPIIGLMCIPPQNDDPYPYFHHMREMATAHKLPRLSMGMSADFESAIAEGATEIRVGTAIFGERQAP